MEPKVDQTAAMVNSMRAELGKPAEADLVTKMRAELKADEKAPITSEKLWQMAREKRDQERAEREKRWNELRTKARAVKEKASLVVTIAKDKELRGQLNDIAKEKTLEVARNAGEKLKATWEGDKKYISERAALMLAYADAEAEKAILAVGRKAVAPLVEKVLVPAAKLMEAADERMIGAVVVFDKVEAKLSGGVSEGIRRIVESDGMDFLWDSAARSKENAKKKGSLRKMVETIGGWIGSARARSEALAVNADRRRKEANQIRDWNEKRKKHELSAGLAGVGEQLRKI